MPEKQEEWGGSVICDSFEHGLDQIPDREDTYFLVVTRGHRYDKECLDIILKKPHCYVGMMASRGRAALLKKQMEEEGIDRKLLDGIHTPVGMPIQCRDTRRNCDIYRI